MTQTLKTFAALAVASFGIGAAQADLVDGDFSGGVATFPGPRLTAAEIDGGWFSNDLTFVGGSGVATTDTGETHGHIVSQVFSNTQTGLVTLNFDWTPAASEELNYAVYGYNSASGNLVYINTTFSNNGPVDLGGGTRLAGTASGSDVTPTWSGVTGDTTSAQFDITGYSEIAVTFWQPASASGSLLDNVSIVSAVPGSATSIKDVQVLTTPGTTSGLKATLTFTANGPVDIYASDTLDAWGEPIATEVSDGTYIDDDQSSGKRFYVIVPAGATFPPTP